MIRERMREACDTSRRKCACSSTPGMPNVDPARAHCQFLCAGGPCKRIMEQCGARTCCARCDDELVVRHPELVAIRGLALDLLAGRVDAAGGGGNVGVLRPRERGLDVAHGQRHGAELERAHGGAGEERREDHVVARADALQGAPPHGAPGYRRPGGGSIAWVQQALAQGRGSLAQNRACCYRAGSHVRTAMPSQRLSFQDGR